MKNILTFTCVPKEVRSSLKNLLTQMPLNKKLEFNFLKFWNQVSNILSKVVFSKLDHFIHIRKIFFTDTCDRP
jgi:hypothetical protein